MLKFTYTETGLQIERLTQSVEELVALRVILAMRIGQSLCVEPTTASFLLPAGLPELHQLEVEARKEAAEALALCPADAEFVEVSLRGTWLAADPQGAQGVFVTALCPRTEFFLLKCWLEAQTCAFVSEAGD
ncbi:MAG: hypothetical protein KME26_02850 [Oscillatoria princeps RMCB-10]|jgi:hypothetical protein|nr:hypothetical protein [Oscillatoria princeps RMCB-10]